MKQCKLILQNINSKYVMQSNKSGRYREKSLQDHALFPNLLQLKFHNHIYINMQKKDLYPKCFIYQVHKRTT